MNATGREYSTKLILIENRNLTAEQGGEAGGVILLTHGRRITVLNTLTDRLNLVFDQELPVIRSMLFPSEKKKKEPFVVRE